SAIGRRPGFVEKGLVGMRFREFETMSKWASLLFAVSRCLTAFAWIAILPAAHGEGPTSRPWAAPAGSVSFGPSRAELLLKEDVSVGAGDAREGRARGTKGIEASAEYIAETFKKLGLKSAPGTDGYFQQFDLTGRPKLSDSLKLAVNGPTGEVIKAEA